MSDILIESIRASIMGIILAYLWWIGAKERLHHQRGWWAIVAGFVLIFLGSVVDITDNYDSLNKYVIIGDTAYEAFLEKVAGNLVGAVLLLVGLWYWLPLVAALRKAEQDLSRHSQELETANRELVEAQGQIVRTERLAAIGQLAGSVAHDLRNPLGGINNAVYYLKGKAASSELAQSNPRVPQMLQIIEDEVDHSNKIITDLLSFSSAASPSIVPTSLAEVIEHTLSSIEFSDGVHPEKRLDPDLPDVPADGHQLQRVFVNLIVNAQDAMVDGGVLTIDARRVDGYAEVAISDTGVGISDEDMSEIFEPLFTSKASGTGLGLAICQQIVLNHGGTIDVASKQGEGTTFTVRLPLGTEERGEV